MMYHCYIFAEHFFIWGNGLRSHCSILFCYLIVTTCYSNDKTFLENVLGILCALFDTFYKRILDLTSYVLTK